MSWNAVKNPNSQTKNSQKKQKPNIIIDKEDLEGLGNDSIFSALSDIDNKEQKKIEESNKEMKQSLSNNSLNKEMKKNSSNSPSPSPKLSKKNQDTPTKIAPIEELSKLNVSDYIKKIKISDNEQEQIDQLKRICNFIETEITSKIFCATTKFSHKSFDIDNPNFKGPVNYLNPKQKKEIENVFSKCKESVIQKLFVLITKCIFVGEKKAGSSQTISNTIAHQICVQIISNLYPGIFYKNDKDGKQVYELTIKHHKEIVEKSPAIGNTLIWICKQQKYNINKKQVHCPEYVSLWMECFLSSLASSDAALTIKIQSIKLLNEVLNDIKENKDKLNKVKVKIPLESFIALVAILKNEKNASLIKKNDKLYESVNNAYESLKSLLFENTSEVLEFEDSNSVLFEKLHRHLTSDQNPNVYNELLSVMALSLAKDPTLFEKWKSIYKQYHPKDVVLASDMIKEIKHQQTEYYKNKKYCPVNNCWENLDNYNLRNTLYDFVGTNQKHRSRSNDPRINDMNKNIKSILNKSSKNNGSFLGGLLKFILKRSLLLIIIISLSLHIFDSVDNYNYANKKIEDVKLPAGHPKVAPGADFTKCPYHNFRNKYSHCNQCSPVIKYVYDFMEEPYKYVESRAVIPIYNKVWKPYCSKAFMTGLEKGVIPAYRYVKPFVNEKVVQPVQNNVIPKAIEFYDTYAKEHVENANRNVFRPAYDASSKYAKQAYTAMKPYSIKAKEYTVNNIINPSIPYVNKAKVRAIQYGNQFLDTLAEVPYQKLLKKGTGKTLRYIGYAENNMERAYAASTPYVKKYWDVLSRKTEVVMKQDNVQKVLSNPYVMTTTNAIKDAYNIWSDGVKTIYVYLTRRGPETGGSRNWKEANNKVSFKNDIKNSIDFTKRYFKGIIKQLENEDNMDRTVPEIKERKVPVNKVETKNVVKEKPAEKVVQKAKEETKKIVKMDTKTLAMEKAKIKQKVKSVVMNEFKNTISKQIAEEKRRQATKTVSPAEAKTKQIAKEKAETTKNVAKEKAAKDIAKNDYETTKQVIKEKANAETKKLAKEKVETAKNLAKETATKGIAKNDYETSKQLAKEKANVETKKLAREKVETAKHLAKEKANSETKKLAKEKVETAKHLAKEYASKNIARQEYETTKQLAMENAIKEE